jgi:hypothetical protein
MHEQCDAMIHSRTLGLLVSTRRRTIPHSQKQAIATRSVTCNAGLPGAANHGVLSPVTRCHSISVRRAKQAQAHLSHDCDQGEPFNPGLTRKLHHAQVVGSSWQSCQRHRLDDILTDAYYSPSAPGRWLSYSA